MPSIYQQQLGADFQRLHPRIQERLSVSSEQARAFVGEGVMERVWHAPLFTAPFLRLGLARQITFPETGENVPFRIENYAYRDPLGRETVTWIRRFFFPRHTRCFDATMVRSLSRGCIIDYLGTHQHVVVDIALSVTAQGGLRLHAGQQRLHTGRLSLRLPHLLATLADVEEWYDDEAACYRIQVEVRNPMVGKLFGYYGSFKGSWRAVAAADIPAYALPLHYESRE
ncbi:MAG: DUF4166 domain-containing protein [Janthinobacterium lividum]